MSTNEIIQVLARGQVKRGLVATIPEGWRSEQIADRLEATGFASRDEFLRAVSAPASVPGFDLLGQPTPTRLEGYLFPETYEVPQKVAGTRAAELMVRMFSQRVGAALHAPDRVEAHAAPGADAGVDRRARSQASRPSGRRSPACT